MTSPNTGTGPPSIVKKKKKTSRDSTDGHVIKINAILKRDARSYTSHSHRWEGGYKFDTIMKKSRNVGITYAVGRTGKITTRGEIEPVNLAGTPVTFATLNNHNYTDEL
ncbi:DNA ligase (NAD(+)) LigA, partial [Leptospira borgpetersenii serovar Hardjo-bovis]|nr:DNA ligase (NAD(+)) LigA [Leptospira borgpetersenii serovar Hardjo-bovis]